jgi:hypothetical protein
VIGKRQGGAMECSESSVVPVTPVILLTHHTPEWRAPIDTRV